MPAFKSKPTKAKAVVQPKPGPKSKKAPIVTEPEEEESEEPEDDEDLDEDLDDIDEDVSIDEADIDEDDDDEGDDEEEDEDEDLPPAKRAKQNGKETPVKDAKAKLKEAAEAKKTKKDEQKKDTKAKKATSDGDDDLPVEDRASAVGPLTDAETKMFADNFRAMSATSVFVGKLPEDATEEDLKKLHPAVRIVRRPVNRKGEPRTFAFLNFPNQETAERALKEINSKGVVKIRGQEIVVSENGNGQCHPPGLVDRRKLKIYGCPKHASKEEIQKVLGCVEVVLNDRDKGQALEAVAVYRTSADAKKVLLSHPTVMLNGAVCALFYRNISHNVKQLERKKDRKQAIKKELKERKARARAKAAEEGDANGAEDDDEDSDEAGDSEEEAPKSTPLKAAKKPAKQVKPVSNQKPKNKRPAEDSDDDEAEEEEEPMPKKAKAAKKVSMRTPQKTPSKTPVQERKSTRKGTPYKQNGGGQPQAKKMKA